MEVEPDLGAHAPPPQVVRGLVVAVLGAQEHLLAAAGPPGSFLLHARAPCAAGHAVGPHALAQGRGLDGEVEEVLHGLRRPQQEADEAGIRGEIGRISSWALRRTRSGEGDLRSGRWRSEMRPAATRTPAATAASSWRQKETRAREAREEEGKRGKQ